VLRVQARQTHARTDAFTRPFTSVGEALQHARDFFPAPTAAVHVLEQAPRADVGGVQPNCLLQPLDRRLCVGLAAEAHLELGGTHQHRALVDVVACALDLDQVALTQLGHAATAAVTLFDGGERRGILRLYLEQPQERDARGVVVVQLFAEDLGLQRQKLRFSRRASSCGRREVEQAHGRLPLAPPSVFVVSCLQKPNELFGR
jgi:hypothetical protein